MFYAGSGLAVLSGCTYRCSFISMHIALTLAEHISASQKQQNMSSRAMLQRFVLIPFKHLLNTFLVTLVHLFVMVLAVVK